MAAATLLAAPHRPLLIPLPSDWTDLPEIELSVFPDGAAYSGDRISVSASTSSDPGGRKLEVRLDTPGGAPIAESNFSLNGISGTWGVQFPWVWDSSAGEGWHTLFACIDEEPAGRTGGATPPRQYPVQILPAAARPAMRRDAAWLQAKSACCEYFFLSGSEAERDIAELIPETEEIYRSLVEKMGKGGALSGAPTRGAQTERGAETERKLTLAFLPRMYGQGGLATQEGILSYMDRFYTGTDFSVVLKHEMAHLLVMARSGTGPRAPMFLQEGWAVFLTGGHYRSPESLQDRAAALLRLGDYTPLSELANSFYAAQHEAAYIEAGAFLEYLAGRFGRDRVLEMMLDPSRAETPAAALDAMLSKHFQKTLAECEEDWLATIQSTAPDPETERDVEFALNLFDLIRRYQRLYIRGVSMSDLWIPEMARARTEQITADYLPAPATTESITLEVMFLAARKAAGEGRWGSAREMLAAIERVLDAKQRRVPEPILVSAPAEAHRRLAAAILRTGGEPLSIDLNGDEATAETRNPATLEKETQHWTFVRGSWVRSG